MPDTLTSPGSYVSAYLPVGEEQALIHEIEARIKPRGGQRVVRKQPSLPPGDGSLDLAEALAVSICTRVLAKALAVSNCTGVLAEALAVSICTGVLVQQEYRAIARSTSQKPVKLLVYEALSYYCMRP